VEWKNYFIRGREMPERIFTEPITREAFFDECPNFCAYVQKYMRIWGWDVEVKTEW
jgi:hypothetical protein